MKINYKSLTIILTALFIYIGVGCFYIYQSEKTLSIQKYLEVSKDMKSDLEILIDEKEEAILLVSLALSQNCKIKKGLRENNISSTVFNNFFQIFQKESSLKNLWFQVLDNRGVSIYRSWTKNYGDSMINSRIDVKRMIEAPKVISSISTGKFDMTFKSMVPIFYKKKFIGIMETISSFDSITQKMRDNKFDTLIVVDKSYKRQLTKASANKFIYDYYISNLDESKTLVNLFEHKYKQKLLNIPNYIIDDENNLFLSTYHLKDMNTNEMGYFILSKKLSDIDFYSRDKTIQKVILALLFIAFLIIGFAYYIYISKYKRYIEEQNQKLEDEIKVKTQELYYSAYYDGLTNLPNRVLFMDRLQEFLKFAKRKEVNVFVVCLDLDRFKEINDTYGHNIGDKLLKVVANKLQNNLRGGDTISRLGGDEFTIFVEDIDYNDMIVIAKKIVKMMQDIHNIDTIELYATFSIGISSYPADGDTAEELLKNADTAMNEVKKSGKNSYRFYNKKMSQLAQERVVLENDIKRAFKNREFEVYFQPKMNAKIEKIIGLEALIRWRHPEKGMIFPNDFIPFAEEIGLIGQIGIFMRYETMKITKDWIDRGLDFGIVSFNASTIELEDDLFVDSIRDMIIDMDYDASRLELEILESQSMKSREKMITVLEDIKKLGLSISIDDFGTGYSSLSYLKQLPVDKLKIDRSFVQDIPHDKDSIALVRSVITLAKNFNLEIIAEGVETKNQVDFMLREGCENIQGYYYSKPKPVYEIEKLLIDNAS